MISEKNLKLHLESGEKLIKTFRATVSFNYVPNIRPHTIGLGSKTNPKGLVAFTNYRIIIFEETGIIDKRKYMYTAPLSHIKAVMTKYRIGEKSDSDRVIAVMLSSGLGCIIALAKKDMKGLDELEHFLVQEMLKTRGMKENNDDVGALAAINYYEEEKRRKEEE